MMNLKEEIASFKEREILDPEPHDAPEHWVKPEDEIYGSISENKPLQPFANINEEEIDDIWSNIGKHPESGVGVFCTQEWTNCAYYKPLYFYHSDWGIYIRRRCVKNLAKQIAAFLNPAVYVAAQKRQCIDNLLLIAYWMIYHHEYYHYRTESFGLRLHDTFTQNYYVPYSNNIYQGTYLTVDCLEEALADAYMYKEIVHFRNNNVHPNPIRKASTAYMRATFPLSPPGYSEAVFYRSPVRFGQGQGVLLGQIYECSLAPVNPIPRNWDTIPDTNKPYFANNLIRQHTYWI
jgi:hypothetical protein